MRTTSTGLSLTRILLDIEGAVARIALRNPPLNVIDIPMMEELAQVVSEVESQSDVAVIILRGAGKAFSAGVDIAAHTTDKIEEMLRKFHG